MKNTWLLVLLAALLAGFIFGWEKYVAGPARLPMRVLPGFKTNEVTSIQVRISGQPDLLVERTNGGWHLTKPLAYPARQPHIEALLLALERIVPDRFLTPRELMDRPGSDSEFGFENPSITLMLFSGEDRKQVLIGSRTAPGNQMFVQVVGVPGVHLVATNLLGLIPQTPGDWRDPAWLDWKSLPFDRLLVTSGTRTTELERNPTNKLWRLVRLGARADSLLVEEMLAGLRASRIAQFVTDDPRADLDAYGLLTPDLDITFSDGTNVTASLQFGKSPTNNAALVYARRRGTDSVVAVPREITAPWRAAAADLRDRHLVTFWTMPDTIEITGRDTFSLVRGTSDLDWRVMPQNFPADTNYMLQTLMTLARMEITNFVKDAVIESALTNYGLAAPRLQYVIKGGNTTNASSVGLHFGDQLDDTVFARRTDEKSVYAVTLREFNILPVASCEMRNRRIWSFAETDVRSILIERDGGKREFVRHATNVWSSVGDNGTRSMNDFAVAIEDTVHRIGDLSASFWADRGKFDRAAYGFTNAPSRMTVTLRDGTKHELEFGGEAPSQYPYAIVTLEGEQWVFEFPWATWQMMLTYLPVVEDPK